MKSPDQVVRESGFMNTMLKIVPDDPVIQARYIYYLSLLIFCGLLGFAIATWHALYVSFAFQTLFQGIFMSAISLLSLFGLKQTRNTYITVKSLYSSINQEQINSAEQKTETVKEMMEEFK